MKFTKPLLLLIATVSSVSLLSGCFSSNPKDIAAFKKPYEVNVSEDKYILQPADQILAICPTIQEISTLPQQTIRPDGKVSFPNIGDVEVAGKTPIEAAEALREKFAKLYNMTGEHPIDVRIAVYQSSVYYVIGQVDRPGPRLCSGRSTALTALAQANPNVLAWGDRIQVIRPSHDPAVKPKIFEIKWDPMVAHGEASKDVLLQPGDIVFVPPTVLAA
ncbi:MAG: polysaccharide biosynthesis/export family protein, partial [Sedimentisphaerales bacterium]|nr:polysaccharide biosynthesis/export family protein [Sedimentisphaerales bacterium]